MSTETQVQKLMRLLKISEEEALRVIADDKAINQGKRMPWNLSKEQEKQALKYANVTDHKKPVEKVKREREPNLEKREIINEIFAFCQKNGYEMVEIGNKEREITFKIGENNYSLTLTKHRNTKKA